MRKIIITSLILLGYCLSYGQVVLDALEGGQFTSTQTASRSDYFKRNDCPSCHTSYDQVYYYQSETATATSTISQQDADTQAFNQAWRLLSETFRINGQNKANTEGTCTPNNFITHELKITTPNYYNTGEIRISGVLVKGKEYPYESPFNVYYDYNQGRLFLNLRLQNINPPTQPNVAPYYVYSEAEVDIYADIITPNGNGYIVLEIGELNKREYLCELKRHCTGTRIYSLNGNYTKAGKYRLGKIKKNSNAAFDWVFIPAIAPELVTLAPETDRSCLGGNAAASITGERLNVLDSASQTDKNVESAPLTAAPSE